MLGGLEGTGVTGLVLYPEGLRHLFGFGEPILTPADLAGRNIRTIRSRDTDAIISALGGVPVQPEGDATTSGIADGTLRGAESSFALISGDPRFGLPIATGNLVPYAKIDSLVVNDGFWSGVSDAQRTIVQDAANATRAWAIDYQRSDAQAARNYCRLGGSVILADTGSLEQFRALASNVVAELAKDASTDALMTRIREAAKDLSPAPVQACEAPIARTIEPDGGDLPDGLYKVEYTVEYLERWGAENVSGNQGVWTYRLEDGHWTVDVLADDHTGHATGIYQVKGNELYWRWDNDAGAPIDHLTWSAAPNGDLTFTTDTFIDEGWNFGLPLIFVGPLTD